MFLAAGSAASAAAASGGERLPFFRNADYHVRELPSPREALLGYSVYHEFDVDPRKTAESAANFAAPTWNLEVRGKVGKTLRLNAGDLVSMFPLEERVYRFRTITGVGMVVPWLGFPLELLLDRAAVSADAKFATFTSLQDPEQLPNQRPDSGLGLDWPYRESLTLAEASPPARLSCRRRVRLSAARAFRRSGTPDCPLEVQLQRPKCGSLDRAFERAPCLHLGDGTAA